MYDTGMVLPRGPGAGQGAVFLSSVLAQPLSRFMGRTGRVSQFHFLLLRCVFQLVKICLLLASHIVSAPQSLSHCQPVPMLSVSSVMLP